MNKTKKAGVSIFLVMTCTIITLAIVGAVSMAMLGYKKTSNVLHDKNTYHTIALAAMMYTSNCLNNDSTLIGTTLDIGATWDFKYMEKFPVNVVRKDEKNILVTCDWRGDYGTHIVESCIIKCDELTAEKEYSLPGLFADEAFTISGSTKVSFYDSDTSTKESDATIVGSNDVITINKPENMQGYPASVESSMGIDMPTYKYVVPDDAIPMGIPTGSMTLNAGKYHFAKVVLSNLTITGNVVIYVDGEFDVSKKLIIQNNYTLVVFQKDFVENAAKQTINGNLFVSTVNNPQNFVFVTEYSGEITLNGNANMGAMILAPYATFKMNGTFDMNGSIFAKSFDGMVNGTYKFRYDTELSRHKIVVPVPSKVVFNIIRYMNNL